MRPYALLLFHRVVHINTYKPLSTDWAGTVGRAYDYCHNYVRGNFEGGGGGPMEQLGYSSADVSYPQPVDKSVDKGGVIHNVRTKLSTGLSP